MATARDGPDDAAAEAAAADEFIARGTAHQTSDAISTTQAAKRGVGRKRGRRMRKASMGRGRSGAPGSREGATGRLETMPENGWPPDFPALRRGEGCTMCGPGADETPHGLRIFQGAWADGYIGRHPVRPGYAYVIWKGRHVSEPTELTAEETAGFWSEVARVAG